MHNIPTYFSNGSFFCEIYPAASNHFPVNEQDIIELYFFIQIIAQIINFLFAKKLGVFNLIKFMTTSLSVVKYSLITIELSCVIELSFEIRGKDTKIKNWQEIKILSIEKIVNNYLTA